MRQYDVYQFAKGITPPIRRKALFLALVYSLVDVVSYLKNFIFNVFMIRDNTLSEWSAGTFAKRARVRYRTAVFESLIDGNTSNPSSGSGTWKRIQDLHVGAYDRAKYTGNKLQLEIALNAIFSMPIQNPPTYGYVYITTYPDFVGSYTIGATEPESSTTTAYDSSEFVFEDAQDPDRLNFRVHFPIIEYNALGPNDPARERLVRDIVDRFIYAGLKYDIGTYVGYPF